MKRLLLLFLLLFVPFVSAYNVNEPVNIEISLLYDNGVSTSPVLSQSCIISIFSVVLDDLVVRDVPMLNISNIQSFMFVPNVTGDFVVNVFCSYLNDSKSYFETISVSTPSVSAPAGYSGGQMLVLSAIIHPERSSYIVDLSKDSKLSFLVDYQVNSVYSDVGDSSWKILRGDVVVDSGKFLRYGVGLYKFDFDFSKYLTGDYKIVLNFDGRSSIVDLSIISTQSLGIISGYVTNPNGSINGVNVGLSIIAILFILLLLIVVIKQVMKK